MHALVITVITHAHVDVVVRCRGELSAPDVQPGGPAYNVSDPRGRSRRCSRCTTTSAVSSGVWRALCCAIDAIAIRAHAGPLPIHFLSSTCSSATVLLGAASHGTCTPHTTRIRHASQICVAQWCCTRFARTARRVYEACVAARVRAATNAQCPTWTAVCRWTSCSACTTRSCRELPVRLPRVCHVPPTAPPQHPHTTKAHAGIA